ncbi:MAG: AmmeMemoRadiSam system protein A [Victivallaceae bacterium]|nr:AmmeMemoRadiSam system protein A [Victivallaceae bacterium]
MTATDEKMFSPGEERDILAFVRAVIAAEFANGVNSPAVPEIAQLAEKGACFVTIKEMGDLRGCIGNLEAFELLGENLRRNAINAAFSDPRFPPLDPGEFEEISIEISILTPPRRIASLDEFELGRDGIILECRGRGAVFLPQVAPEQGWDKPTTLDYLSRKAGLAEEAWRGADAVFSTFRAVVFSE